MNLRDLEYLLALAETRHFGEAAQRCQVTQPTLSTQISKLEKKLGVEIFERGRRLTLTNVGREIILQASVVLDEVHRLKQIAKGTEGPLSGPFRLGVIYTAGPYLLPTILPEVRKSFPELKLLVREGLENQLLDRLRLLDLDAAILSLPIEDPAFDHELLLREDFVLALPLKHPLTEKRQVTATDLADASLLLLDEGHCMREQTFKFCEAHSEGHRTPFQASSIESLRQMVSAGIGCTLLPAMAALGPFAEISPVAVRRFASPTPYRELVLVWRKHYPQGASVRRLAQLLQKTIDWTKLLSAVPAP